MNPVAAADLLTGVRTVASQALAETAVNIVVAIGTLGAVVAALVTAWFDRRSADSRAEADRRAFAERQREEREYDRRMADVRMRLDLLLRAADAYERALTGSGATQEAGIAGLRAILRATPTELPLLRAYYNAESLPPHEVERLNRVYGVAGNANDAERLRAEFRYHLANIRRELAGRHHHDRTSQRL